MDSTPTRYDGQENQWFFAPHNLSFGREQAMGAGTPTVVAFAGGECGNYAPTGYTTRVDMFEIADLIKPNGDRPIL